METTTKHKDRYENISCNAVPAAFALLTIGFGSVCTPHAETASSSANQQIEVHHLEYKLKSPQTKISYQIPRWVDATPTIFPEQSNEPIVPPTEQNRRSKPGLIVSKRKNCTGPIVL